MSQKWYRKNVVKAIVIFAEHALLLVMVACVLWLMSYPVLRSEIFRGTHAEKYEDTSAFAEQVLHTGIGISNALGRRDVFETDGVYDPDKIIDVVRYNQGKTADVEDHGSLSYRLGDMVDWGKTINQGSGETGEDENTIIVCRRADDTYHYYYYNEFRDLILSGELSFITAGGEGEMSQEDILLSLRDQTFSAGGAEFAVQGIRDKDDRVLYVDCWNYDGYWCSEEYQTAEGKTILEVANEDETWNGRLSQAFDEVETAVMAVSWEVEDYQNVLDAYQEGDTNLAYFYVDQTAKEIFSNRQEYQEGKDLETTLEKIKENGKYVIVYPRLADFETNMKSVDAANWRDALQVQDESYVFALSVDTSYPVQDSFYTESRMYEQHGGTAIRVFAAGVAAAILFALGLIWLTFAAGRRPEDEELHLSGFDRWKTELAAVLIFVLWIVPVLLIGDTVTLTAGVVYDEYGNIIHANAFENGIFSSAGNTVALTLLVWYTCAMFLAGYLSLVRRIKAKTLWKDSLLRSILHFVKTIFRHLPVLWQMILAFGVVVLFHWIAFFSYGGFFFFGIMVLAEAGAFVYLVRDGIGKQRIKKGIEKIAGGQVDYKINRAGLSREQQDIADKINSIGEGLDRALAESIKSERLKTDLITNVSHDIKTPLTSIINYVELLKQENFQDPRIRRYIEVLEQKSQRLKTLTEDVVEASKVSSGNITLEYMDLNFVEMIQQTSGEFEEKFKARNLTEVLNLPNEEVVIRADGRRMWRVLGNIYNNAAKYALEGTRIYADLKVIDGHAVFSLKNISQQPLNISADELTERFIRGDISRSTEGSGLGLSIAKTLTEMQGGSFELYLDGDLFRVTITF